MTRRRPRRCERSETATIASGWNALQAHNPRRNLSIEDSQEGRNTIQLYDRAWQAADPELDVGELLDLVRHAYHTEQHIVRGEIPPIDAYFAEPYGVDEHLDLLWPARRRPPSRGAARPGYRCVLRPADATRRVKT